MRTHDSILPLILGAIFATVVHLGAAAAYVTVRDHQPAVPEPPRRPDLIVESIDVPPPRLAGQESQIVVRVRNTGRAPAASPVYRISVDGDVVEDRALEGELAADAAAEIQVVYTAAAPGPHRITIDADPNHDIDELDETNNSLEESFTWLAPPTGRSTVPDFFVDSIAVSFPRIAGRPATLSVRLGNLGAPAEGEMLLGVMLDGTTIEQPVVAAKGRDVLEWSASITVAEPGPHEITVVIDPQEQAEDADRVNNTASRTFVWEAADKIPLGQKEPSVLNINWISAEAFEEMMAHKSLVDQAAVQAEVEPVPRADTPPDPTPPLPLPSPAPAVASSTLVPPAPRPQPARAQSQSTEEPAEPKQAPPLPQTPAAVAAAPIESEPAPPTRIEPKGEDAPAPQLAVDDSPAPQPVAAPRVPSPPAREVALATPPVPANSSSEPRLPEPAPTKPTDIARRRSPDVQPDERSDPDDKTLEIEAPEPQPRRLAALPLTSRVRELIASLPDPPDQPPTERETARPPAPSEKAAEEPTPRPDRQAEPTPPRPPAADAVPRPTAAPRDRREAPPSSRVQMPEVRLGAVTARQGVRVNTKRIAWRLQAHLNFRFVPNPVVEVTFNRQGEAINAKIARESGNPGIDGPLLSSLYGWTAEGEMLEQMEDDRLTVEVRILLLPEE